MGYDFDTRATLLTIEIKEDWEDKIKQVHRENKETVKRDLLFQFGERAFEQKLKNFIDLGPKPFSVIAYHNRFLEQSRIAFTMGAYYPALTGVCALGERILNHLILLLREDYRNTPEYKKVYRKDSFDNWLLAIDTLDAWGVLLEDAVVACKKLHEIRNRAIHFNPEADTQDREMALDAIKELQNIITIQFGSFGGQPWFIEGTRGVEFIKKQFEEVPFVKKVYIPNSSLVGPFHKIENKNGRLVVIDNQKYEDKEITDEEFWTLHKKNQH